MTERIRYSNTKVDKAMNQEQFEQVVEAIIAGKYSWACVLILRFAGYNPLHYIPYRTYNRLLKENCQVGTQSRQTPDSIERINDLGYLEVIGKQQTQVRGGNLDEWLSSTIQEYNALKIDVEPNKQQEFSVPITKFLQKL